MRINHNIAALNTYRQLGQANNAQQNSMEKLSSGLRINSAKDDAAGLAISEKMRGQIRGLEQASTNAQDANSLIQTAEGALNETHSILQRMRELSVQASNDTNTDTDRGEIQKEIEQLTSEIDRISTTTEFNSKSLINGNAGFSADIDATTGLTSLSGGNAATGTYTMAGIDSGKVAQLALTKTDASTNLTDSEITTGKFDLNGTTIDVTDASMDGLVSAVNAKSDETGITARTATDAEMPGSGTGVIFENTQVGSTSQIKISNNTALGSTVYIDDVNGSTTDAVIGTGFTGSGSDANADDVGGTSFVGSGNVLTGVGGKLDGIELKVKTGMSGAGGDITVNSNNSLSFQIGANKGQDMNISINDMSASALQVNAIDVTSASDAKDAISTINDAIETVSGERSKLGAYQNRLDHTVNNLSTSSENLTAAESRIRDVDYDLVAA